LITSLFHQNWDFYTVLILVIVQTFVEHQFQHIYIVDGQRKLLGAVSLHQVKAFLDRPELETVVIAGDVMDEIFLLYRFCTARGTPLKIFRNTIGAFASCRRPDPTAAYRQHLENGYHSSPRRRAKPV
jgi:hypothetical protein